MSVTSPAGNGGEGIRGSGLAITNSGTIQGGLGGAAQGAGPAGQAGNAITFTGGTNMLTLQAGSVINGNVDGTAATSNTLVLGGTAPWHFDVSVIGATTGTQWLGFQTFQVNAANSAIWTLQNTTTAITPWQLLSGTLSVSDNAQLGDASGALTFNGGTLQVTGNTFSDFGARNTINWGPNGGGFDIVEKSNTFSITQDLSGGPLKVNELGGLGTLWLIADYNFAATDVYSGALRVDGSFTSPTTTVHGAGTLGGSGSITGDVANFGTVAPGVGLTPSTGSPGTPLTINGNYVGHGGYVAINTALGDSSSTTDQLVVNGGTITGTSGITVTNVGGAGGVTTGNGIPVVVATGGTTTSPNAFTLVGPVTAGPFQYVFLRGMNGTADEQNSWYVCSTKACLDAGGQLGGPFLPPLGPPPNPPGPGPGPDPGPSPGPGPGPSPSPDIPLYRPEASIFSAMGGMARELSRNTIGTFHDYNGDQGLVRGNGAPPTVWARVFGQATEHSHSGTLGTSFDGHSWGLQSGIDLFQSETPNGFRDRFGIFMAYAESKGDVNGFALGQQNAFVGTPSLEAISLGGYWTRIAPSDWYIDARVLGTRYTGSALSEGNNIAMKAKGEGFAASLEGGYPIPVGYGVTIEPQLQLIYSYLDLSGTDRVSNVDYDMADAFYGRLGVRLAGNNVFGNPNVRPYLKANLWQDFTEGDRTIFDGLHVIDAHQRLTAVEVGGGVTAQLTQHVGVWGMVDYTTDIAGDDGSREIIRGSVGARIVW